MAEILIVEDDEEIACLLKSILEQENHRTLSAFSAEKAWKELSARHFDLVLLDLMLPGLPGEGLLAKIRAVNQLPVVVISAKLSVNSKVDLLRGGADDYIAKPFAPGEVTARVEAALRRYRRTEEAKILYDDLCIDTESKTVRAGGLPLRLTAKEYAILRLLCSHPAKVFSKANLFESVWDEPYAYDDNTLGVHISNLRKKLKEKTGKEYIDTIWGMGYKIK